MITEQNFAKTTLSIEQLKNLPLREGVWIEVLEPFAYEEKVSAYYRKQADYSHNKSFCCGYPGLSFSFDYADYNKTWTAYIHQPKTHKDNELDCPYSGEVEYENLNAWNEADVAILFQDSPIKE